MKFLNWLNDNRKKAFAVALLVTGVALSVFVPAFAGFLTPYLPAAAGAYAASISAVLAAVLPVAAFGALVGTVNATSYAFTSVSNWWSAKKAEVKEATEETTKTAEESTNTVDAADETTKAADETTKKTPKTETSGGPVVYGTPTNAGEEASKKSDAPTVANEENKEEAATPTKN